MKYTKTNLSYNGFVLLIAESLLGSSGESVCDTLKLPELCDGKLTSDACGYPDFYYFSDLDGAAYVLEENESEDATVVYKLEKEGGDTNSACEYILRDTLAERENKDTYLSQYELIELNHGTEPCYIVGEFCMHSKEGWYEKLEVQEDMFSVIKQFLVGRHTETMEDYAGVLQGSNNTEFGTKIAASNKEKERKAIQWIERSKSLDELNGLLLPDGRNMVKIIQYAPAVS